MVNVKKVIITSVIIVAASAGAAILYFMPEKIMVDTAKKTDVIQTVKVTGNIKADEIETLYAPVSGRIHTITIQEGETVKKTDMIASYDITLIENEYMKAAAILEANKQNYEAAVSENKNASSKFATAQAAENSNRTELEAALQTINALDIANRSDYLEPEEYNQTLDLETKLKNIEQDTQINLTDKTSAESRLEGEKSYKNSYRDAYHDAKDAMEDAQKALDKALADTANPPSAEEKKALESALAEAKSRYKTAKNEYSDVKERIEDAESDVKHATDKLNQNKSELSSALNQLDAINKMNYSKMMSDEEYMQYVTLESKIKLLEQDLAKNLSDRQYNESKLINSHTIEQYQYNVDMSEVDVNTADYTLSRAKEGVKADKSGVILEKYVDSNAMVEAGTPICTLQPTENIKVEAMISKFDIDKVSLNQEADIIVGETAYHGKVTKIFPVAEKDASGKPKVKVWVEMDVADKIPTIGLEAQVILHTGEEKAVLAVPYESVYSDEKGDYVYILDGTQAVKKYIQIGIKGNDNYSVVGGISEGANIIVTPFSDDKLGGRYTKE